MYAKSLNMMKENSAFIKWHTIYGRSVDFYSYLHQQGHNNYHCSKQAVTQIIYTPNFSPPFSHPPPDNCCYYTGIQIVLS